MIRPIYKAARAKHFPCWWLPRFLSANVRLLPKRKTQNFLILRICACCAGHFLHIIASHLSSGERERETPDHHWVDAALRSCRPSGHFPLSKIRVTVASRVLISQLERLFIPALTCKNKTNTHAVVDVDINATPMAYSADRLLIVHHADKEDGLNRTDLMLAIHLRRRVNAGRAWIDLARDLAVKEHHFRVCASLMVFTTRMSCCWRRPKRYFIKAARQWKEVKERCSPLRFVRC